MRRTHHFTHQGHELTEFNDHSKFLCNGCRSLGFGSRYRCHPCNFDLHDYCAECPPSLNSFMHPNHPLQLMLYEPQHRARFCNVCFNPIGGLYYHCNLCQFDLHPLCTKLPQHVRHSLHPHHYLTLQTAPNPNQCAVCRNFCTNWRYRCADCNFDIHIDCILVPYANNRPTGHGGFNYHQPGGDASRGAFGFGGPTMMNIGKIIRWLYRNPFNNPTLAKAFHQLKRFYQLK
ncbi:DC1 [Dillenia turbinata]|uniref:DC1 n=1 Tax=Dillenia turbinata TaxID=194707 RepID=A0AAN8ZML9_9MAGN